MVAAWAAPGREAAGGDGRFHGSGIRESILSASTGWFSNTLSELFQIPRLLIPDSPA